MSDHADTIRDALATAQRAEAQLAGEFASTDPSDAWTQRDVYEHVYLPLSGHLLRVVDLAAALLSELDTLRTALGYHHRMHRIELENEGFVTEDARLSVSERYASDAAALAAAGPEQGATP